MPEYVAYFPGADDAYILRADSKRFPRRATAEQAAQDVQDAWHNPTKEDLATHLVVYRLDGERVTPLTVRVRRVLEVRAA